jgi:hypothetical protein
MIDKKPVPKYGWNCGVCGKFVASSSVDGYPVSCYWRNTNDPQVLVVFCSAACGLKDYEMRRCTTANIHEEDV